LAIVEALLAGDRLQAVRAMSYHIRSGGRYWSRVLPEEGSEKGSGDHASHGARVQGSAAVGAAKTSKGSVRVEGNGR
jgi:hypothetical protein